MTTETEQIAVITGGAQGLGLATAERFLAKGYQVAIVDRNNVAMEEVEKKYRHKTLLCIDEDLAENSAPERILAQVQEQLGTATILVNNAGIAPKHGGKAWTVTQTSLEEWHEVLNINLTAALLMCKVFIPGMQAQKYGRIVNVSSSAGRTTAVLNGPSYMCSKAGLIALSRHIAQQYGADGITANTVAFGRIVSPLASLWSPELEQSYNQKNPVKRSGRPEEAAAAIDYLSSALSGFTNGAILDVNGGAFMP